MKLNPHLIIAVFRSIGVVKAAVREGQALHISPVFSIELLDPRESIFVSAARLLPSEIAICQQTLVIYEDFVAQKIDRFSSWIELQRQFTTLTTRKLVNRRPWHKRARDDAGGAIHAEAQSFLALQFAEISQLVARYRHVLARVCFQNVGNCS